MPLYDYECPKCGKRLELEQSINNRIAPKCFEKDCNVDMEQIIGTPTFILKGDCWGKDGYSSKK